MEKKHASRTVGKIRRIRVVGGENEDSRVGIERTAVSLPARDLLCEVVSRDREIESLDALIRERPTDAEREGAFGLKDLGEEDGIAEEEDPRRTRIRRQRTLEAELIDLAESRRARTKSVDDAALARDEPRSRGNVHRIRRRKPPRHSLGGEKPEEDSRERKKNPATATRRDHALARASAP